MTTHPAPNILLISTDQQRFNALGAQGNPDIRTPNLDRLASEGVLFDNCYVPSPVCAPSRASLMTGQYPHRHGLHANGVDIPRDAELFTRNLADAGYDCALVGKFHLGACQHGRTEPRIADGFRVFRWAHDPYRGSSENAYHRWLQQKFPELHAHAMSGGSAAFDTLPTEAHYSRWVGDEAIDYLTSSRDTSKPFCFVVNFFDPHHGFGAPKEYRDLYDADSLPAPITSDLSTKPEIFTEASRKSYAGHAPGFLDHTPEEIQDIRAQYYAMVTLVDDEVGRILDALDAQGLADDTIVVFTSDHGEMLGDHQMLLKGPMMFDVATRVPLVVRWPGRLPAGARREQLVSWIDLAPTLLRAAGAAELGGCQGQDITELATTGRQDGLRDWVLSEYRDSCWPYDPPVHTTMLRQGPWKIVVHHGAPATDRPRTGELYDLARDPDETTNLWDAPAARDDRDRMQGLLLDALVATENRSQPRLSSY
ncbi:sulfatase-like hydrolase/transferase [Streptomyces sp. B6B3]|uniref:sulfatase family protein n=1 Tax=Streptomyces sp. B6B3 TaxID=3153570 RepID=UPI00325EC364